jgi:hypothetical protein
VNKLLLALAFACAPAFADINMVVRDGKDYVRLSQAECHPEVAKLIPEQARSMFAAAVAVLGGKEWKGCWTVRSDGNVLVVYADGDMALIPVKFFNQEQGV